MVNVAANIALIASQTAESKTGRHREGLMARTTISPPSITRRGSVVQRAATSEACEGASDMVAAKAVGETRLTVATVIMRALNGVGQWATPKRRAYPPLPSGSISQPPRSDWRRGAGA